MEEYSMGKEEKHQKSTRKTGIRGDQNMVSGNVSSGGIVMQGGQENVVTIHQFKETDAKELTALFEKLYQYIESRPSDPNVEKEEITGTLQKIEEEASKGEQANRTKIERWVENLNRMAPDIVDVILASLGGPVSGVTAILKKVADHARQQSKA
jgi:hypothetical protein